MRHAGHIRSRSEGSFELRYTVGYDPSNGKQLVKTVTYKGTHKGAEVELRRILKTLDDNTYVAPTKKTVESFLNDWLTSIKSQVSPKTHERYAEIVRNYLIPSFGHTVLSKLLVDSIQEKYNTWEHSGRRDGKEGGLSPRTRLHIHRVFKEALKHAVKLQLMAQNPADVVLAPRPKKKIRPTLTVEQSVVLLRSLRKTRIFIPVLLALTTGMRRGEILALRWKNVDFENKTIRVVESLEQVETNIRFKAPKNEKTRAIMLPSYAAKILGMWKVMQQRQFAEHNVPMNDEAIVCARYNGEPLKPDSLTQEFRVAIRQIPELPIIRFHDLRHSHATQMLRRKIHPKIAQERLGHSNIATTLDIYSHVIDTMQDDAASGLDNVFRTAITSRKLNKLEFQ